MKFTPNDTFRIFRRGLGLSQTDLASKLSVSQGTITDIERGRIGVSKRIVKKINDVFKVDYFEVEGKITNLKKENTEKIQRKITEINTENGLKRDPRYSFPYRFRQDLKTESIEKDAFVNDVSTILEHGYLLEALNDTKIGDVIFFGVENFLKIKTFGEFKELGNKAIEEAIKYKEFLHEYAEVARSFAQKLKEIKDEIGLDYDFDE